MATWDCKKVKGTFIIVCTRTKKYKWNLNSKLVRYSNGPKQFLRWMLRYLSHVLNSKLIVHFWNGKKFSNRGIWLPNFLPWWLIKWSGPYDQQQHQNTEQTTTVGILNMFGIPAPTVLTIWNTKYVRYSDPHCTRHAIFRSQLFLFSNTRECDNCILGCRLTLFRMIPKTWKITWMEVGWHPTWPE